MSEFCQKLAVSFGKSLFCPAYYFKPSTSLENDVCDRSRFYGDQYVLGLHAWQALFPQSRTSRNEWFDRPQLGALHTLVTYKWHSRYARTCTTRVYAVVRIGCLRTSSIVDD